MYGKIFATDHQKCQVTFATTGHWLFVESYSP